MSIAGGDTTDGTLLTPAGSTNTAATLRNYKPVSAESLIEMQPDLVLVSGHDWRRYAIHDIDGHALQGALSLNSLQQANQIAQWLKQGS